MFEKIFDKMVEIILIIFAVFLALCLLLLLGTKLHTYYDVNSQFQRIQQIHKDFLQKILINKNNKPPKLLLSYRYRQRVSHQDYTQSCYSNFYTLPNKIDYELLNKDYHKVTDLEKFKKEYDNTDLSLFECVNTEGAVTWGSMIAPYFHYKNGVLVRGSTKHINLTKMNMNTANTELWIANKDDNSALLIDNNKKIVKIIYR